MKETKLVAIIIILLIINFPLVGAISISNVQPAPGTNNVTIKWRTDAAADSSVEYGKNINLGSEEQSDELTTSHSIDIVNLDENTLYYYKVKSGNATDNNSGSFYQFTTLQEVDVITLNTVPETQTTDTIAVTGTTEPNAVLTFFVNGNWVSIIQTQQQLIQSGFAIQTDETGKFNATIRLSSGENEILVVSKKDYRVARATYNVNVDVTAPSLFFEKIATPRRNSSFEIIGTAEEGATAAYSVIQILNSTSRKTVKANQSITVVNRTINTTVSLGTAVEGKFLIILTAKDSVGNSARREQTIDVDNKAPALLEIYEPNDGEEVHYGIIKVEGKVSEPGATVRIRNLGERDTVNTESGEEGPYDTTSASIYFDPVGLIVGYESTTTADANGVFSENVALIPGTNIIQIIVIDEAGNQNTARDIRVSYTLGNSVWRIGRISTIPNCIYANDLKAGDVYVSLMFYLNPTISDELTIGEVSVSPDGSKKDNKYIGSPITTTAYHDPATNEVFVYAKLPITMRGEAGDIFSLPDSMDFALKATINYYPKNIVDYGSSATTSPPLIDSTPVYFETSLAVEKPLKYSKWLTPRMINKTIKIIDAILNPIEAISKFADKLAMVTMGACALYTMYSYFTEPDYQTLYTICDRVQCPTVPPACQDFAKSFDWKSKDGRLISDGTMRKYIAPQEITATEANPLYRDSAGRILAACAEGCTPITSGTYYSLQKPEMVGGKVATTTYYMSQQDHSAYVNEFDVYVLQANGQWVPGGGGKAITQEAYDAQRSEYVTSITENSANWQTTDSYYRGATENGRYTVEYIDAAKIAEENRERGLRIACPRGENAILTISERSGEDIFTPNFPGLESTTTTTGANWQCTTMTKDQFLSDAPTTEGISRCYSPGPPNYDNTRCLDSSVRNANPADDIIISARCGCITGVKGNLDRAVRILKSSKQCLQQAYVGQVRGGYCERMLAQYVCDLVFYGLEKLTKGRSSGGIGEARIPNPINIKNNMEEVNKMLNNRYPRGDISSQFGFDSRQLVHATCVGMVSQDWSTFKSQMNMVARTPVEPVIGPLIPESRIGNYNPGTGALTINYLMTIGIMSGGQDVEYEILLECDPNPNFPNGESCPSDRRAAPLLVRRGYVPIDGTISENILYSVPNSYHWYNKAILTVKYEVGIEARTKTIVEEIAHKGALIYQCHIETNIGIRCETMVPGGVGMLNVERMDLVPLGVIGTGYAPENQVLFNARVSRLGELPETIYLHYKLKKPAGTTEAGIKIESATKEKEIPISSSEIKEYSSSITKELFKFKAGEFGENKFVDRRWTGEFEFSAQTLEIIAKERIENNNLVEREIVRMEVKGVRRGAADIPLIIQCRASSSVKWVCTNPGVQANTKVYITEVYVKVRWENPVEIFRKTGETEEKWFDADVRIAEAAEFLPSQSGNLYSLTVTFYKDLNTNGRYDTGTNADGTPSGDVAETMMTESKQPLTRTFTFEYKTAPDCNTAPLVEIIEPFMPRTAAASDTSLIYLYEDSKINIALWDDCNAVSKEKLQLFINEGVVSANIDVPTENSPLYAFNTIPGIQNYQDGEVLKLKVKATDDKGKTAESAEVRVIKKTRQSTATTTAATS